MAWLGTWAKRRKITIPAASVDADDTLPVAIHLGTAVGISPVDVSDIFDDLGSNSKKIALTLADGETETVVEIERWDSSAEKATLWARVAVTSGSATELYLYWDPTESDNTNIKDAGAATTIWPNGSDEEYQVVYLMGDAAGNIVDSTANNLDSISEQLTAYQQDGMGGRGYAIDFESGSVDFVEIGDLNLEANDLTVMLVINVESVTASGHVIGLWDNPDVLMIYARNETPDRFRFLLYDAVPKMYDSGVTNTSLDVDLATWTTLFMGYTQSDADGFKIFKDGVKDGVVDPSTDAQPIDTDQASVSLGAGWAGAAFTYLPFDGLMAYAIIAKTQFTDAMLDLFQHSFTDTLSTWSATENFDAGGWSGKWNSGVMSKLHGIALTAWNGVGGGGNGPGPLELVDHTTSIEGGSGGSWVKDATNEFSFTLEFDFAVNEKYWFMFEITGNAGGKTVTYDVNVEGSISGPTSHCPAYSFDGGVTWAYIPQADVSYYDDGSAHMVFDITFPGGQNTALIAATIPMLYTDLVAYAAAFSSGYGSVSSYLSEGGRNCYIFTIDDGDPDGKDTIWIIAGVEPSETWAQYHALGLIDHLLTGGASTLRSEHNWKIIPMINPDGNFLGKTQRNVNDVDLTLEWDDARSDTAELEIQGCMDAMRAWETAGHPIECFIDLHVRYIQLWMGLNCNNSGWFDDYNTMLELETAMKTLKFGDNWSYSCSASKSWGQIPAEFGCAALLTESNQWRSDMWFEYPATVANLKAFGADIGDALEGFMQ